MDIRQKLEEFIKAKNVFFKNEQWTRNDQEYMFTAM